MRHKLSTNFAQYTETLACEDAGALILASWCRVEQSVNFYMVANHGNTPRTSFAGLKQLEKDNSLSESTIGRLHELRKMRNRTAHGGSSLPSPSDAIRFSRDATQLAWEIRDLVSDTQALSSGAALLA